MAQVDGTPVVEVLSENETKYRIGGGAGIRALRDDGL